MDERQLQLGCGREHSTAQDWLERVVICMIGSCACHSQGCSLVPRNSPSIISKWSFAVAAWFTCCMAVASHEATNNAQEAGTLSQKVSSLKSVSQCNNRGAPLHENFSSWSNSPSKRRVAKMRCELNEEVGPDKGISFLQGCLTLTHGTRVVIALKNRYP